MLVTSIFSFLRNVFYLTGQLFTVLALFILSFGYALGLDSNEILSQLLYYTRFNKQKVSGVISGSFSVFYKD